MLTDPVADLFTRMRNAIARQKVNCMTSYSRKKWMILGVLKETGYILDFAKIKLFNSRFAHINIKLKYHHAKSVIQHIEAVSKPGLKIYVQAAKVPYVHNGLGIALLSTSQGLVTDAQARQLKIGGKVLAYVW